MRARVIEETVQLKSKYSSELTASTSQLSVGSELDGSFARSDSSQYYHTLPIHREIRHSPFSSESPVQNYRGFFNLSILLVVVNNLRLVLENYKKYGVLISIPGRSIPPFDIACALLSTLILSANVCLAFLIEFVACKNIVPESIIICLDIFNIIMVAFTPIFITSQYISHFTPGVFSLFTAIILVMKLISYHLVNFDLRKQNKKGVVDQYYPDCPYPSNITFGSLLYFWFAPTLCYQPSYPRTPTIRPSFVLKRLVEFISSFSLMYFVLEQYAVPTVLNSLKPMQELKFLEIMERLLKLSVSNIYIWLLLFYMFFHAFLNALAEILRFGDRSFYLSWWNACNVDEYWRLWNVPVHSWMKRHLYLPLRAKGLAPHSSLFLTFLTSAVLHELAIGLPSHVFQFWAFGGILFQVPLIYFTRWYSRRWPQSSFGNYFFWATFCVVGQPMCTLLYYRAWAIKYSSQEIFFV